MYYQAVYRRRMQERKSLRMGSVVNGLKEGQPKPSTDNWLTVAVGSKVRSWLLADVTSAVDAAALSNRWLPDTLSVVVVSRMARLTARNMC